MYVLGIILKGINLWGRFHSLIHLRHAHVRMASRIARDTVSLCGRQRLLFDLPCGRD